MSEINFGIVGTGRMASTMMGAFKHLTGARVVAVSSESANRTEVFSEHFNIPKAYNTVDDLLTDKRIDAVYIANATESHATNTIKALKAGKAVLCEKPIAISEAESKLIEAEAIRSGKLCMEAMWTLFLPAYQRMFELHAAKTLGDPIHLFADFGYPANKQAYPRLYAPSPGSGVLLDRGVYPIALAIKLFGSVRRLTAQVDFTQDGVDTHASLLLSHQNGCHSQLAVSIKSLLQNKAVLSFTGGSVSIEPPVIGAETVALNWAQTSDLPSSSAAIGLKEKLKQKLRESSLLRGRDAIKEPGNREYHSYGVNQYLPVLNHFCELYRVEKQMSEIVPLSFSTEVLRIVDQAKILAVNEPLGVNR